MGIRAGSAVTPEAYLRRRLNRLVKWTKLRPNQMLQQCPTERAARGFIANLMAELEAKEIPTFTTHNYIEALVNWLNFNGLEVSGESLRGHPRISRVLVVGRRKGRKKKGPK